MAILITLLAAELTALLVRARDVVIVSKTDLQRTAQERERVNRGLVRSLLLEGVLFVPCSVGLISILSSGAPEPASGFGAYLLFVCVPRISITKLAKMAIASMFDASRTW